MLSLQGHKNAPQNHPISWPFSRSNSNGKEKDWESGFHYYGARYYWSEVLTGWLSVDPMSDKYPSMSPYNYCAWNPAMLVDPDGNEIGDFYNLKGEWIGMDGINDGRIFLVTNESDVSMILKNGENCDIQTTNVSDVKSAIEPPSANLREDMLSNLIKNDNSNPYREYGGLVIGETNLIIAWAKPGPEFQYGEPAHINPFDLQDPNILISHSGDCAQKWRFHSHPSGIRWKGNDFSQIVQLPDSYDIANMGISETTSGYAFQFGMRSRMVNIYNSEGLQAAISFELFNNIGR